MVGEPARKALECKRAKTRGKKKFGQYSTATFQHHDTTHTSTTNCSAFTMGTHKKEANRKERQGKTGDGMGNVKVKGENFYRYACLPRSKQDGFGIANGRTAMRRRSRR